MATFYILLFKSQYKVQRMSIKFFYISLIKSQYKVQRMLKLWTLTKMNGKQHVATIIRPLLSLRESKVNLQVFFLIYLALIFLSTSDECTEIKIDT